MKKYYLLLTSLSILGLSGCTPATHTTQASSYKKRVQISEYEQPTPRKFSLYKQTMQSIASGIKQDTAYRRIALDTPQKKAWFKALTYRLWDRQITRYQFMAQGLAKYPTHRHEFMFIVKGFENACGKH